MRRRRPRSGRAGCPAAGTVSTWPANRTSGRAARGRGAARAGRRRPHRSGSSGERVGDVAHQLALFAARRGDVDELERARGEPVGHPRAGIIADVAGRQPDPLPGGEPERGFAVAVAPPGGRSRAESSPSSRSSRAPRASSRRPDRPAARAPGAAHVRRQGQARGAEARHTRTPAPRRCSSTTSSTRRSSGCSRTRSRRGSIDRTQLILDIFAQHAVERRGQAPGRARAARVQPAAHARHVAAPRAPRRRRRHARPRASRSSRPTAGSRGAAISVLKRRLRGPRAASARSGARSAGAPRRRRSRSPGYTNVGKSTLLNALTGAEVSVENRLFETLDPTTRGFELDGRRYLVTDTVGFIRRLPHQLVEGFAATLEETLVADLVLHVRRRVRDRRASSTRSVDAVEAVLHEIGADELPRRARPEQDRRASTRCGAGGSRTGSRTRRRCRRSPARASTSWGADRASASPSGSRRCGCCCPYDEGGKLVRAVRARRADRRARGHGGGRARASRACRAARSGGSRRTSSPTPRRRRAQRRSRRVIELPITRLRDGRGACRSGRTRAMRASTSPPASASSSARASGRWSAPGSRSRSRRGTRASCSRARASPPSTGSRS